MQLIKGLILSRQWQDTPSGIVLRLWIHAHEGPVLIEQQSQEGIFFVEETNKEKALAITKNLVCRTQALLLKSFSQKAVSGFYFDSQRKLRQAANLLKDRNIEPLEADVRTVDRYLMERFITSGLALRTNQAEQRKGFTFVQDAQLKSCEYSPRFKVVSFDIETDFRNNTLLSIAVYAPDARQVFMVGDQAQPPPQAQTQFVEDEKNLLHAFIDWIQQYDPDILIGWNCINFDLRVLETCCQKHGIKFALGRNSETLEWRSSPRNEGHYFVLVPGRAVLDGIDTLKSATYSFESFSLEYVAREVLGKGKLIHEPDDRGEEILRLFHEDKSALARYNLEDCILVWEIFKQTNLIQFAIERARLTGLPLDKVGGSVAAFENQYLPRLHRQGYVAPNLPVDPQGVGSPGGYVMESKPGLYSNVLVLDFKSLYPSIIRTFKIDPYGLTEGDRILPSGDHTHYDIGVFSKGFRGAFFVKENSILPGLIETLWQARDQAKKEDNPALSQAIKIIMNSFYGVMGTPGCRFFDPRLPSSITLRGHEIMLRTRELIEQHGYEVIYGDTDSIFVWLNTSVTPDEANVIGNQLATMITQWWATHLFERYKLSSALELEYENHYTRFLMPTIRGSSQGSKKRYAGLKSNQEIIFKGLETVRTDWTHLAREFQRELYRRIFFNQEYKHFICETVEALKAGDYDKKLIYRKRLRRKLSEYQRNVPPHVQAARKADEWLLSQGRKQRYQHGGWIEYCYTLNGPEPIECRESPLDYDLYLDRQIAPVVDGIVGFLGTSFAALTSSQMKLL